MDVITELVTHHADVNKGDHSRRTPLIIACELGHLELVRLLLDHGADINHAYREDELPEAVSCELKRPGVDEIEVDEMCDPYRGNGALLQVCYTRLCNA